MPNHFDSKQPATDENLVQDSQKASLAVPRPPETPTALEGQDVNLEDAFSKLFKSSVSGTGEEELLRIASNYSLQITAKQIKCLLFLEHKAKMFRELELATKGNEHIKYKFIADYLHEFVWRWLELKQHNNSDIFVMRALDSISLRKFINENTLKVNIEK